jgi:hypothetical protein
MDNGEALRASVANILRFAFRYPHTLWHYLLLVGLIGLFGIMAADLLIDGATSGTEAGLPLPPVIRAALPVLLVIVLSIALVELLWLTAGREVVEIGAEQVVVRHAIFGVGPRKVLSRGEVSGIFLSQYAGGTLRRWLALNDTGLFDFKRGRIGVNVRREGEPLRTFRFAGGVSQREAERVLAQILAQFPQYAAQPAGKRAK